MTLDLTVAVSRPPDADRTGYVLAAVHPDSHRLDAVIARATERAAAIDGVVIYLTVAGSQQVGHHLTRVKARLGAAAHPVHLVATWIDGNHGPRSCRAALVAAEIAGAAHRLAADTVVVGHNPGTEVSPSSLLGQLITTLPGDVALCLAADAALTEAFPQDETAAKIPAMRIEGVHLTDAGRRQLTKRARRIERANLATARRALRDQPESMAALLAYERVLNDYRALTTLIATAPRTAEIPDNPQRVELGERVELAAEDGARRALVVVADVEVTRGRACAAASSTLGRALLGRRVGDWTLVPTSRGPRRVRILAATR